MLQNIAKVGSITQALFFGAQNILVVACVVLPFLVGLVWPPDGVVLDTKADVDGLDGRALRRAAAIVPQRLRTHACVCSKGEREAGIRSAAEPQVGGRI